MKFGHSVSLRALEPNYNYSVCVEFIVSKSSFNFFLRFKNLAGASTICFSMGTAEILIMQVPRFPSNFFIPPDFWKGLVTGLNIFSLCDFVLEDTNSIPSSTNLGSLCRFPNLLPL